LALDETEHPLLPLVNHHSAALLSSAQLITENSSTQIELLRRRLATAAPPSPSTHRVNFLKGIAKAIQPISKDTKAGINGALHRGWDTEAVENMWYAVVVYVRDMGNLLSELVGLLDMLDRCIDKSNVFSPPTLLRQLTSSTLKILLTTQDQSQVRTTLNNTLTALLSQLVLFFSSPPPKDLPSHLFSPTQLPSSVDTPVTPLPDIPLSEWSFLPPHTSALAATKWSRLILDALARRVVDFLSWGEDTADGVRIAVGNVRERLVRAMLVAWRDGTFPARIG
jgi:Exocyst complex component Sec5